MLTLGDVDDGVDDDERGGMYHQISGRSEASSLPIV